MRVDLFTGTVGAFDLPRRLLMIAIWITLMAYAPVVGVLFCFAAIAFEAWLLYPGRVWREFEVDQEGVSLIYRDKVAVRILWHQMRSVYQPRMKPDHVVFTGSEGQVIKLRHPPIEIKQLLDEVAARLPVTTELTPNHPVKEPPSEAVARRMKTTGKTLAAIAYVTSIAQCFFMWYLPDLYGIDELLVGTGMIAVIGTASILCEKRAGTIRWMHRCPWVWNPDLTEEPQRLTIEDLAQKKNIRIQSLKDGHLYRYLPLAGKAPSRLALAFSTNVVTTLFMIIQLTAGSLAIFHSPIAAPLIPAILLLFARAHTLLPPIASPQKIPLDAAFRIKGRRIMAEFGGRVISAPYDHPVMMGSVDDCRLFGYTETYGKITIDPRFLAREDTPIYVPESPWDDLWRGRHLPK